MALSGDGLRLPPPWITPAAGLPNREVPPVIIVQRRRLLYPAYVQDYLDRVTAADIAAGDGAGLEVGVTDAVSAFMEDLVSISYLGVSANVISQAASIIKASAIMAGARTLPGALVPLVGAAPTNFNFVAGDYDRKTGLIGNGSTKYLGSNRANNADPQNSNHNAVYATSIGATNGAFIAALGSTGSTNFIAGGQADPTFTRSRSGTGASAGVNTAPGLVGHSRAVSGSYTVRTNGADSTVTVTSSTPETSPVLVFRRGFSTTPLYATHRIAFYSIGEALTLSLLEAPLTTLINTFAAVIP
jgi:hypothetical protein